MKIEPAFRSARKVEPPPVSLPEILQVQSVAGSNESTVTPFCAQVAALAAVEPVDNLLGIVVAIPYKDVLRGQLLGSQASRDALNIQNHRGNALIQFILRGDAEYRHHPPHVHRQGHVP